MIYQALGAYVGAMPIYLDYNATALLRPQAQAALMAAYAEGGNASSVHAVGRAARARLENARRVLAGATGFKPEEVIFTSGGTESNQLALRGIKSASVLVSAIEHASVLAATQALHLPVTADGVLDLLAAEEMIAVAPAPALVSVMWVNNETGVIQPIAELFEICRKNGALLHVDAVQALGRISLDVKVDALTLSAHKVGGPLGVGALLVRDGIELTPLLTGGGQEKGRRAGTENAPGISAFAVAVQQAISEMPELQRRAAWRDAFEAKLQQVPGVQIVGGAVPRVANTTCLVCPGFKSDLQLMQLDLKGIAVSSGSACSSGKVARSHVLAAMGMSAAQLDSALRVSFGWNSKESELNFCAEIWTQLALSAIANALSA